MIDGLIELQPISDGMCAAHSQEFLNDKQTPGCSNELIHVII